MDLTFKDFIKLLVLTIIATFIATTVTSFKNAHIKRDSVIIIEEQNYRIINVEKSDNKIILDVYKIQEK